MGSITPDDSRRASWGGGTSGYTKNRWGAIAPTDITDTDGTPSGKTAGQDAYGTTPLGIGWGLHPSHTPMYGAVAWNPSTKQHTERETTMTTKAVAKNPTAVEKAKRVRELAQRAMTEMKSSGEFDAEQMILDIMEADDLDALLDSSTVYHLRDIVGTPFTINRVELQESDYAESALPAYAVIYAVLDDEREVIVTTGATTVVAQLVKMHMAGWFPARVSSTSDETSNGYTVIKLCKAPEPVESF